jgi:hypothetical protein
MKQKIIAIALSLFCVPVLPQNCRAQVVESVIGGSACAASVGCGVIVGIVFLGGVGYYVLNANGRKFRVHPTQMEIHARPIVQPGPKPSAFYAKQERHGAVRASDCNKMAERFRRAGRRVRLVRVIPNDVGVGGVLRVVCLFEGEDAQEGWYGN